MTPNANILAVPFRRGTQLSLSSAVRQYISTKYDQHPNMFEQDLDVIDLLRRDAVNMREPLPVGLRKLTAYLAQLVWMSAKFPIEIGAEFTWYPALGYNTERPVVQKNLQFEMANVLYNLAALYSQLAVASNRPDTNGLKTAASFFSHAAGVLQHLKDHVLPELNGMPPDDMDEHTLDALLQLQLAQSQECYWHKAVVDGYKDASIAKLAARLSDLYNSACEAAMRSEAISSAWIHHMSAKHHHFAAAAQCRAACDCLEKRRYGEEVARLKDAVACVNEGLKENRGGYLNKAVVESLNGLKRKVEEDLKRAEKDNDIIYLQTVPHKSELKVLDRANMATARVPPQVANPLDFLGEKAEFGPALFTKLVPYSVHHAVSAYEERRDRLVNQRIISELEVLNETIHELLSSLNLPGSIQAFEKPLGLPHSLTQHAEEVRQADALSRLHQSFADIDKLRTADIDVFNEGKELLQAEEEEDAQLRRRYGTDRWSRHESRAEPTQGAKLWKQAQEAEGWFENSASSDGVVREKFRNVESMLAILSGSSSSLIDYVPSSRRTEIPEALRPVLNRLRGAYNDITRLESRRRRRADTLRDKARMDDIKSDILVEAGRLERAHAVATAIVPAHFDGFFEKRLESLYEPEIESLRKDAAEQEQFVAKLQAAARDFDAQKKAAGDRGNREREQALQRLENAYYKYKELLSNVEVGRKFYNDLSRIVGGFRDGARSWTAERRREARVIENELTVPTMINSLNIGGGHIGSGQTPSMGGNRASQGFYSTPQSQPQSLPLHQHRQSQAKMHQHPHQQQHSITQLPAEPPPEARFQAWAEGETIAPQPQQVARVWNSDMEIKFAPGAPATTAVSVGGPGQAGNGPAQPPWDPTKGIRFG